MWGSSRWPVNFIFERAFLVVVSRGDHVRLRALRARERKRGVGILLARPATLNPITLQIHPLSNRPEPKSRFVPSKHEAKQV